MNDTQPAPPASPLTAGSSTGPAPGAATPGELTPYQRRKQREEEREKLREERRAAREAKALATAAAKVTATPAATPAPASTRTDEDRERDAAVFLVVVWMIARFFAYFAGFKLAEYTPEERKKDAFAWVPVARRYGSFDTLITWVAVPAVLMQRIESKMRRKGDTRGDAAVASEAKH